MSRLLTIGTIGQNFYTFDPIQQTLDYESAVVADGGTIGSLELIDAVLRQEVDNNRLNEPLFYFTSQGRKGNVSELYMLHNPAIKWTHSGWSLHTDNGRETLARSSLLEWSTIDDYLPTPWCYWGWIYATGNFSDSRQGIIGRDAGSAASCSIDTGSGNNRLQYIDSGATILSSNTTPALANNWRFICFQGSGNTIKKYVDGVKIRDIATAGATELRRIHLFNVNGSQLHGRFDLFCLRLANVSDQEVTDLYNATKFYYQ